jgi:hypothetical protein
VTPKSLSFWAKVQLALLRTLSIFLATVDSLLNVRWGERLLAQMAKRWQENLDQLDETLAQLEKERAQVQMQAEAIAIHAAAIYLGGRSLTHAQGQLCFDPADPRDEEILDASIDLLVKERLAAIRTEEIEEGHYIYHLEPDWAAIRARLETAVEGTESDIAEWFREGLKFIDEAFLSRTDS